MKVFTIGFTQKSAKTFFERLKTAGVKQLVDVRLYNVSQLARFSKRDDLAYFAKSILEIEYRHWLDGAPTAELAPLRHARQIGTHTQWILKKLVRSRHIEQPFPFNTLAGGCFLCSEKTPDQCHRRLVVEYLQRNYRGVEIEHLI